MTERGEGSALAGDFWGGLGAMLVALPSAIAFGVAIFSSLGAAYAAQGALAGVVGATVLGLVASVVGGTRRLISAPCAPAAAVLAASAVEFAQGGSAPEATLAMLALVAMLAGAVQIAFGALGIGRLIKYMPYPVVSGYLSGVGLIIIASQWPKLVGAPHGTDFWHALAAPDRWQWEALAVGAVTMAVMAVAPKLTRAVPATILALAAGVLGYFALAAADRSLLVLAGNPLLIGPVGGSGAGLLEAALAQWGSARALGVHELAQVLVPALTLAVLLSIDTLKTCVVLDALTRSRHAPNRELIGQGAANLASALAGGVPGAGTMGATLVNISGGAQTRASGFIEGVLSLAALLALGGLIAWLPIAALAGILIVVGLRMIDWRSIGLLRNRSTVLDFLVIAAVVVVAETYSLVWASAVGVGLAIVLFIREQVGSSVVHRRSRGSQVFSKQVRLPDEMRLLQAEGDRTAIFELQGSLFFGTTDKLYRALSPELERCRFLVLDLQRVQSVDITAVHLLEQIEDALAERGATLLFSELPRALPSGRDMQRYFDEVGLAQGEHRGRVFKELDAALEWVENRLLEEAHLGRAEEQPLELREFAMFAGRKEETLAALEACTEQRSVRAGERIFARGDGGDELYLIRRGAVRVVLPISGQTSHHVGTFGRGNFFGEMSFLDQDVRSADAIASADTDLYVLSRQKFDALAEHHKRLAGQLLGGLARVLAIRLRYANAELRALRAPSET